MRPTYDQLAADILLQGGSDMPAKIQALKAHAEGRIPCPDCGHEGPHETNEASHYVQREFLCTNCGSNFEAPSPPDVR